jgi:glycosyltransferase involved in cell wall biosynthesis
MRGAEGGYDPEFDADIHWDVPLLDGYTWSQVPNLGSGKESFFGLFNPGLWKHIRSGKYDAVLCYIGYVRASFWVVYSAARAFGAAFLFGTDAVSLDPLDGHMWKRNVKRAVWPILFRIVSQVLVSSSTTRELMLSLRIPHDRITLTPSTVDNDWWMQESQKVDRAAVRASWGVSSTDTVFVYCAKLQPWKRPLDLLRAFAKANLATAHLIFAGEGPLRPQLEAEAADLGVAARVRVLRFVNQTQLPAIYKCADLMVLPSSHENFGFVVNEAMSCGCPVAASHRVGSVRDLVAPVSPDLVFPCGDLDALAKILKDAAADRPRLKALARAALAHIQTWSPERNIAATVEALRVAVQRKRGRHVRPVPADHASHSAPSTTHKFQE